MIADARCVPERVFLDGEPIDLTRAVMADDQAGIVELLLFDTAGNLRMDSLGEPLTEIKRGDVRIFFAPAKITRH